MSLSMSTNEVAEGGGIGDILRSIPGKMIMSERFFGSRNLPAASTRRVTRR